MWSSLHHQIYLRNPIYNHICLKQYSYMCMAINESQENFIFSAASGLLHDLEQAI